MNDEIKKPADPMPISADVAGEDPVFETAIDISEYSLEMTRRAYIDRDFDAFAARFHLPQIVGTFDGERVLETREDLRAAFHGMLREFDRIGGKDLFRKTISAQFVTETKIQTTFVTRYLLENDQLGDEIFAHGTIGLVDGRWVIFDGHYASSDALDVSHAFGIQAQEPPKTRQDQNGLASARADGNDQRATGGSLGSEG